VSAASKSEKNVEFEKIVGFYLHLGLVSGSETLLHILTVHYKVVEYICRYIHTWVNIASIFNIHIVYVCIYIFTHIVIHTYSEAEVFFAYQTNVVWEQICLHVNRCVFVCELAALGLADLGCIRT